MYFLRGSQAGGLFPFVFAWLLAATTWAQAPAWTAIANSTNLSGASGISAVAADASGNLFVTGQLIGQLSFGPTTLTSVGSNDIFVAKYVPATTTWAWAVRAGGSSSDAGRGIAVSGTSVYVTGSFVNNTANVNGVTFQSTSAAAGPAPVAVAGSTATMSSDLFVAKYTDTGSSAILSWTQVAGGTGQDYGSGVAASGTSVYVVGDQTNNLANASQVVFGGTGATGGNVAQPGASATTSTDVVLAKYTDNGSSATLGWTQVAGGTGADDGNAIAVSGSRIYIAGALVNSRTNGSAVLFGGSGATPGTGAQYGAASTTTADLFLAKYTDTGLSATVNWTQVGGGSAFDGGFAVTTSGTSVYVAGNIINDLANTKAVVFGGSGTTAGTLTQLGASAGPTGDILVAKYTDNGPSATLGWTQVGGGTDGDVSSGIAASGNRVYVAGTIYNNLANGDNVVFGGTGTTVGTVAQPGASSVLSGDLLVAAYTDNGSSSTLSWMQVGGGTDIDIGYGVAVVGTTLHVAGTVVPTATFGNLTIAYPPGGSTSFIGSIANAVLATTPTAASLMPHPYPNPASGPATLSGAPAGATVGVFDALGRRVATATADAQGAATLPAGLPAGLYLVRAGAGTVRWAVE